jgi:hypothetical protein
MRSARRELFVLICTASFLLYALTALALHQDRAAGWNIEAQGPIPAAISHLVYGTPLGALDHTLLMKFYQPDGGTVQDIMAAAAAGSVPRGATIMYTLDGNGVGANLFATLAMWLFGIDVSSLILFYLVFVGTSALAFVCRYRDQRLIVVPLYFSAVTIMLLTPLSTSHMGVNENAIGGIRFFVLAAFLPALHIFFELIDRSEPVWRGVRIFNYVLLFVQGILFSAALLVRSSTGYLLGPLLLALAWRLYRDRAEGRRLIPLGWKSAIVVATLAFWTVFVVAATPAYVHNHREFGIFWHRAFASLSFHPAWPFGSLQQIYDCKKYIPEELSGAPDRNAQCIWFAYPPNKERPPAEVSLEIYDGKYEMVLRNAYFYVVTHYPRQAFELYFLIKPQLIKQTFADAWSFLLQLGQAPVADGILVLVAGQLLLFVLFIVSTALGGAKPLDRRMMIFPLLFLVSLAPRFVAWASWVTGADLIFLMYSCFLLAPVLAGQVLFVSANKLATRVGFFGERKSKDLCRQS